MPTLNAPDRAADNLQQDTIYEAERDGLAEGVGALTIKAKLEETSAALETAADHQKQIFAVWAILAFTGLAGAVSWHYGAIAFLTSITAVLWLVACSALLALPLLLLLLDPPTNLKKGPRLALPVCCTLLIAALAIFVVADAKLDAHLMKTGAAKTAFFAYLLAVFIPLGWNALRFSKSDAITRAADRGYTLDPQHGKPSHNDAISALSRTIGIALIVGLAFLAGYLGDSLQIGNEFGIGLLLTVLAAFMIVIFSDTFMRIPPVRMAVNGLKTIACSFKWLAKFYQFANRFLIRIVGSIAHMGQRTALRRYLLFFVTLSSLAALGWWLPAPLGLLPLALGFMLAFSVSRMWNAVESDRELSAMTEYNPRTPYVLGFREDYRDEALFGFAFIFVFLPIAMWQLHAGEVFSSALFDTKGVDPSFFDWVGFFGIELAKAVPIVDWAEIYNVQGGANIDYKSQWSRHTIFAARVLVDLLLIAALLQALSIAARNRQQKELYKDPSVGLNRLDPFVERSELKRAYSSARVSGAKLPGHLTQTTALECFKAEELKRYRPIEIDFRTYDRERLTTLKTSSEDPWIQTYIYALDYYHNLELRTPARQLLFVAETSRDASQLYSSLEKARENHSDGLEPLSPALLQKTMVELRATSGLKDLKLEMVEALQSLVLKPDGYATLEIQIEALDAIADIVDRQPPIEETYQYTRKAAFEALRAIVTDNTSPIDPTHWAHLKERLLYRSEKGDVKTARTKFLNALNALLRANDAAA